MKYTTILLIVVSVLMSAVAQIVLKAGMSAPTVTSALAGESRVMALVTALTNPIVLAGLTIYFLSAVVWLLVLARVDVSFAYPFVGLGFVVTMLLGWLVHGEILTLGRVAGTLLIGLGVVLIATR